MMVISQDCGAFSTNSTAWVDIPNLSVSITTSGKPVFIKIMPKNDSSPHSSAFASPSSTMSACQIQILRNNTKIAMVVQVSSSASSAQCVPYFETIDQPGAGTFTYKAQLKNTLAGLSWVKYCILVAYELGG